MFNFKLTLYNPHNVDSHFIHEYNNVYTVWENVFSSLLKASNAILNKDDFFRSDYILAITKNSQVVALANLTHFDLRLKSTLSHHYINEIGPAVVNKLTSDGLNKVLTIEYLTVLPEWRRHQSNIDWLEVVLGCASMLLDESNAQIILGTPRVDVKVDRSCKNVGAIQMQDPISKMNYPCSVMVIQKQSNRVFKNTFTEQYVKALWKEKQFTENQINQTNNNKKSA